jgi:hypothetical protein
MAGAAGGGRGADPHAAITTIAAALDLITAAS